MALDATSNTLVTTDKISAYLLRNLVIGTVFPRLVTRDFDKDFTGGQGDTAKVRKPASFTTQLFDGSPPAVSVQNASLTSIDVKVDKLLDITIEWGTVERRLKMDQMQKLILDPIMTAHIDYIERLLADLYKYVPTHYGTPGTTPNQKSHILQARKLLEDQLVPRDRRNFVMDSAAEAEYLELFSDADKDGSTAALRDASLGRRFGLETYASQAIKTHTPGTMTWTAGASLQLNGTLAAGASTIVLKSSDASLATAAGTDCAVGDVFDVTLDDGTVQSVSCKTAAEVAAATVTVVLGDGQTLRSAATASNNVDMLGVDDATNTHTNYVVNLLFHPGAFALAIAPQAEAEGAAESKVVSYDGFGLRMIKDWNNSAKKTALSCDILLGTKCIDHRLATRLIG